MGELLDKYKEHASQEEQDTSRTEFKQKYVVTLPPLTKNMEPRVIAELPLEVKYATSQRENKILANVFVQTKFQDVLCFYAAINRIIHPGKEISLTECAFLHDKLEKLGMRPIQKGYKDEPSDFMLTPELFQEMAKKDFFIEGIYHGKPRSMLCDSTADGIESHTELRRNRNQPFQDAYYLENVHVASPEEVEEHITKLEEAIQEWQQETRLKRLAKQGFVGFE